jgi:hypothetical protein
MMTKNDNDLEAKRKAYFERTTPEQREQHARNWLINHAKRVECPPCKGKRKADVFSGSLKRGPCVCPKCKKVWIFILLNMEDKRSKWRTTWYYAKHQYKELI